MGMGCDANGHLSITLGIPGDSDSGRKISQVIRQNRCPIKARISRIGNSRRRVRINLAHYAGIVIGEIEIRHRLVLVMLREEGIPAETAIHLEMPRYFPVVLDE